MGFFAVLSALNHVTSADCLATLPTYRSYVSLPYSLCFMRKNIIETEQKQKWNQANG